MTSKEQARKVRLEQWAQVMQTRKESGKSVRAWCVANNINEKTFYYWQRKLRLAACDHISKREEHMPCLSADRARTGLIPTGWTQVATKMPASGALTIEIGYIKIQATQNTDMDLLTKVCQALVPPC